MHELHNDLFLLPERTKIEKVEKLVANLRDKREYVIYIKFFLKSIKSRISFEKRLIKFNQKVWLKSYIDMNTEPRKNAK